MWADLALISASLKSHKWGIDGPGEGCGGQTQQAKKNAQTAIILKGASLLSSDDDALRIRTDQTDSRRGENSVANLSVTTTTIASNKHYRRVICLLRMIFSDPHHNSVQRPTGLIRSETERKSKAIRIRVIARRDLADWV